MRAAGSSESGPAYRTTTSCMPRIARRKVDKTPAAIVDLGPGRIAMPSASISAAISGSAWRKASGRITARNVVEASRSRVARWSSPRRSHSRAAVSIAATASARSSITPTSALPGKRQRRTRSSSSHQSICGNMATKESRRRSAVRRPTSSSVAISSSVSPVRVPARWRARRSSRSAGAYRMVPCCPGPSTRAIIRRQPAGQTQPEVGRRPALGIRPSEDAASMPPGPGFSATHRRPPTHQRKIRRCQCPQIVQARRERP